MLETLSLLKSLGNTQLSGGATFGGGQTSGSSGSGIGGAVIGVASVASPYVGAVLAIGELLGLDLGANIGNVLKYGLNSWGASTDPKKEQELINIDMDKLQELIQGTNDTNLVSNINQMEFISTYVAQYYKTMLSRRKWAGSTTAAFKVHQKAFDTFRSDVLDKMLSKIKSIGATITSETFTDEFYKYEEELLPWNAPDNTSAEKNGTFTYKVYSITMPKNNDVVVDEDGNVTPKPKSEANMGGLVGVGVAVALAKIFKFF